jgi:hypothetical protein
MTRKHDRGEERKQGRQGETTVDATDIEYVQESERRTRIKCETSRLPLVPWRPPAETLSFAGCFAKFSDKVLETPT